MKTQSLKLLLVVFMAIQATSLAKNCLRTVRQDVKQVWAVKEGSVLCSQKLLMTESGRLGLSVENQNLFIYTEHSGRKVEDHWRTSSSSLGEPFGVAVYEGAGNSTNQTDAPDYHTVRIVRFVEADEGSSKLGTLVEDSGSAPGPYIRATYYLKIDDIFIEEGSLNPIIMVITNSIAVAFGALLPIKTRRFGPSSVYLFAFCLLAWMTHYSLELTDTLYLLAIFLITTATAITFAWAALQIKEEKISIGLLLIINFPLALGEAWGPFGLIILILSLLTTGLYFYRGNMEPEHYLTRFGVYISFCGLIVAAVHTTCIRHPAILILTVESGFRSYPDARTTSRPVFWMVMSTICLTFIVGLYILFRQVISKAGQKISKPLEGYFLYIDNMASPKDSDDPVTTPTSLNV